MFEKDFCTRRKDVSFDAAMSNQGQIEKQSGRARLEATYG